MSSIPYAVAFALTTVLSLVVTWRGVQAKPRQGAGWFTLAMAGVTWWSLMKLLEVLVFDFERIRMLFNAFHWIGVWAVSLGVLGFGLSLRGRGETLTVPRLAGLSVIPALTVVAWLGDPRVVSLLVSHAPGATAIVWLLEGVEATWPWFRSVSLVWLWGLVAVGSVFILGTALERPKLDPSRLLLGIMVAVPWAVNLFYEFGMIPSTEFDPTVFGFIVTGVAGIAAIDRFRLFDVPFARARIVERFSTPILVYDRDYRLYDYNTQAATVLDIESSDIDEDVREVLANTPLSLPEGPVENERLLAERLDGTRVSIPAGDGDGPHYLVQASALDSDATNELGYTIQLTDITDQHRQREQIRRERDLKELIRRTLVQLSSREDIEQAFCDQLVNDDRYAFVWIGESSMEDERAVQVQTSASEGAVGADVDRYEPTESVSDLGLEALETGDVTAIHGLDGPEGDAVKDRFGTAEVRGVAVTPLTYNDLSYGILAVYTGRSDAFDPAERRLLADLGESIAFAINAVEQREALQGEQIREVQLEIRDSGHYLVSLADMHAFQEGEATIDVFDIGAVSLGSSCSKSDRPPEAADPLLHFLTVRGVPTEPVVEHLTAHPAIERVTSLRESGETSSLRVVVRSPSIGSLLADVGGAVRTIRVTTGRVQVVAEFSPRTDINRAVDHLREIYPETTVRSLVTKEPSELRSVRSLLASLTAKQREALEAAYHSGFFERPQRQTADEIATALDISRSTFLKHLRLAENTLLATVFSNSDGTPVDDREDG